MSRRWLANSLLLITAAVWGLAFVAQRVGMDYIGPFTFNAVRFALGAVVLGFIVRFRRGRAARLALPRASVQRGLVLGLVLFVASSFQQVGLVYTTAGKAGFITGLYVVLVPLAGALLLGERHGAQVWLGAGLAAAGLYLLSVTGAWQMEKGDLLVLMSAFFWTAHVILVGRWTVAHDSLTLAALQFAAVALLSGVVAADWESVTLAGLQGALWAILYGGLISVGVGYTLQVVAQQYALPAHAAIIMSLEAVFALLGGVVLLGERVSGRGLVGAALMLAGMVISQWEATADDVAGGAG
ncbi:MAG TPA: DMT family transporter [Chloroflexi bacterium]|nr:DMT family transporter [Chloroflexota bacterium]